MDRERRKLARRYARLQQYFPNAKPLNFTTCSLEELRMETAKLKLSFQYQIDVRDDEPPNETK